MLLDSYALFYTLYLLVEEIFPAKKTNSLSREIIYCERKFDIIRGNTSLLNKKIICSHKKILVKIYMLFHTLYFLSQEILLPKENNFLSRKIILYKRKSSSVRGNNSL